MSKYIKASLSALHQKKLTTEQTVADLTDRLSIEELAEYLVEAFNRGWITPFNVGLDSDGNIL